jgi:hypothetical protein
MLIPRQEARRHPVLSRFALLLACLVVAIAPAAAQAPAERVTLGAQLSMLGVADDSDSTSVGIGARGSFAFSRWLAADAEFSFFHRDRAEFGFGDGTAPIAPGFTEYTRRRITVFAGPKVGVRSERFGVFAKARPGFTRLFDRGVGCSGEICALILIARPAYRTEFAMDLGGIVEVYPSSSSLLRFDLGTTVVRHRSLAPPCTDCTTRNLSSSLGAGWRF